MITWLSFVTSSEKGMKVFQIHIRPSVIGGTASVCDMDGGSQFRRILWILVGCIDRNLLHHGNRHCHLISSTYGEYYVVWWTIVLTGYPVCMSQTSAVGSPTCRRCVSNIIEEHSNVLRSVWGGSAMLILIWLCLSPSFHVVECDTVSIDWC